jgi:hypothetical protein
LSCVVCPAAQQPLVVTQRVNLLGSRKLVRMVRRVSLRVRPMTSKRCDSMFVSDIQDLLDVFVFPAEGRHLDGNVGLAQFALGRDGLPL